MLEKIGGIAAIRGELIDDCALARAVKRAGGRVWLGLSETTHSIRPYRTFGGSRTDDLAQRVHAITPLQRCCSAGTVAGLLLTYLAPPLLTLFAPQPAAGMAAMAWLLMSICYCPRSVSIAFHGLPPRCCLWSRCSMRARRCIPPSRIGAAREASGKAACRTVAQRGKGKLSAVSFWRAAARSISWPKRMKNLGVTQRNEELVDQRHGENGGKEVTEAAEGFRVSTQELRFEDSGC
jgi:hypothetical protein